MAPDPLSMDDAERYTQGGPSQNDGARLDMTTSMKPF